MHTNSYLESLKSFLREWDNLQVHEDILYRQKQQQPRQLILSSKLKPLLYNELHVNMGHLGTDRTTELIKWPLMDDKIKHFVTQVCPCVKRKKLHIMKAAAMQSISTSEPLEIISKDFVHLDKSSGGQLIERVESLNYAACFGPIQDLK